MNVKKLMTVTCASLCLAASVFAAEGKQTQGAKLGEWTMDAPAALQLAKSTNKINLLNFTGSDWCGWCKLMDKKVFSTEEWKAYAKENVVLTWVDFPRDKSLVPAEIAVKNNALASQYGVQGYPTYIVLDADGNQIGRLGASQDATPQSFIAQLKSVALIPRLKDLLSAEDYAAYQKLTAESKALQAEAEAWMENARKTAMDYAAKGDAATDNKDALQAEANAWMEKARKTAMDYNAKMTAIDAKIKAFVDKAQK